MAWRLAKSLIKLREQVNAAYPNRSRVSDGSIGDPAHAARTSDHNPNAQGVVTALDITHDPANGLDGQQLSNQLTTDKRTKYVIFAGRIWKARTAQWETYRGSNSHHKHVHISVKAEMADLDSPWSLEQGSGFPFRVTLRRGSQGVAVRLLQEKLRIPIDGKFGPATEKAVRVFQANHGLTVDGIAGQEVWRALDIK